jgi:hypothetical protein
MHQSQLLAGASLAVFGFALSACIGVSQEKVDATAPSAEALSGCPGGLVPAADGNVDDFEDGNNQTNVEGGRDGYWYTAKDNNGSTYEIPAEGFATSEGGADGSTTAIHIKGTTASGGDQAWGIELGMNFLNSQGEMYDASKYEAFSFKAKLGLLQPLQQHDRAHAGVEGIHARLQRSEAASGLGPASAGQRHALPAREHQLPDRGRQALRRLD